MTQEERERECARQRIQDYTENLFRFLRRDFECQERHLKAEGAVVAGQCLPVSVAELREEHTLKNFEDDRFTIVDMVHLCVNKDLKFLQMKKRELPATFWELRRWVKNKIRTQRNKIVREKRQLVKLEAQREAYKDLTEEEIVQKEDEIWHIGVGKKMRQEKAVKQGYRYGLKVAVECAFGEKGSLREMHSLARQLQYSIGANKRAVRPVSLHFVSFKGELERFCVETMRADRWKAHLCHESALDVFSNEQSNMCVLSPDATEPLIDIDESKIYIVGGLVDRTIKKHATSRFAQENGIECHRLPLKEYYPSKPKLVLNVNAVVEALITVHGGASWEEALHRVIPKRQINK
mmetsp:Transcript_12375/g.24876  ORF Transcript_12375/g.24876 Transcript_12375/m.24876 type:complete len:350 (+) Transcript_12375:69-1118(+)